MKYLITGAAGFIGSSLTRELLNHGQEVLTMDNLNSYYSPKLKEKRLKAFGIGSKCNFINSDICNKEIIRKTIKEFEPDQIIHLAAQAGVRLPSTQNQKYIMSNIVGFENILSASIEFGISGLLYASSSSVYGNDSLSPYSEKEISLNPTSFYGFTKLVNENMIKYYLKDSKTRVRGLRFFTVYGPWGRPDMAYFRLCSQVVNGTKFDLYGDGTVIRDFTFIDDVIKATISLAENLNKQVWGFNDVVNIGGGNPRSMNEMIDIAFSMQGKTSQITRKAENLLDVRSTKASTDYLQSLIGYIPDTKLEVGLRKVFQWINEETSKNEMEEWIHSCP